MLVLTRKTRQSIVIDDDGAGECILKVTVLEIRGGRVKLGLEVPAGIRVLRQEVREHLNSARGVADLSIPVAARMA